MKVGGVIEGLSSHIEIIMVNHLYLLSLQTWKARLRGELHPAKDHQMWFSWAPRPGTPSSHLPTANPSQVLSEISVK